MRHEISNSNAGFLTPRVQRGVNTKDSVGRTALHHAAHRGLVAVAFAILSSKRILISQEVPPKKDIMDVRCHQMPSSVSIAKSGWNLEMDELIN